MSTDISDLEEAYKCLDEKHYKNVWEHFKYIRGEIQHEHNLLKGRVTWYITCQSFLITAYVLSYKEKISPIWFSNLLLPILALIITILAYSMIRGTLTTIEMWGKLQYNSIAVYSKLNSLMIEPWHLENDPISRNSLMFPRVIPLIFGIFWTIVLVSPWINPS